MAQGPKGSKAMNYFANRLPEFGSKAPSHLCCSTHLVAAPASRYARAHHDSPRAHAHHNPLMVKQPAMEASEFTMSNEDFPALPGVPGPQAEVLPLPMPPCLSPSPLPH